MRARTIWLVVAISVLMKISLVGVAWWAYRFTHDPGFTVDHAVVQQWHTTLAPGLADLNTASDLPGLKADGPASISPCGFDSGNFFDLSAAQSWTARVPGRGVDTTHPSVTPETAHGFRVLIQRLRAAGWSVRDRSNSLDMELPAGMDYDTVDLTLRTQDATLLLGVQLFDDGVLASLDWRHSPKACRVRG